MKIFGLNVFLILIASIFGMIGGAFIVSAHFTLQYKILTVISAILFAFGCSRVQLYLDELDFEDFRRRVS